MCVTVGRIATGEQEDTTYASPHRRKSGLAGAKARVENTSAERRVEIAEAGASARWKVDTMAYDVEVASNRLYGKGGVGASDLKIFRGSSADVTPSDYAKELNKAISQIENGDFDVVGYED